MELVKNWYGRRMAAWEHELAFKSTDRVVRPFDWGIEWTRDWPVASALATVLLVLLVGPMMILQAIERRRERS